MDLLQIMSWNFMTAYCKLKKWVPMKGKFFIKMQLIQLKNTK